MILERKRYSFTVYLAIMEVEDKMIAANSPVFYANLEVQLLYMSRNTVFHKSDLDLQNWMGSSLAHATP